MHGWSISYTGSHGKNYDKLKIKDSTKMNNK